MHVSSAKLQKTKLQNFDKKLGTSVFRTSVDHMQNGRLGDEVITDLSREISGRSAHKLRPFSAKAWKSYWSSLCCLASIFATCFTRPLLKRQPFYFSTFLFLCTVVVASCASFDG